MNFYVSPLKQRAICATLCSTLRVIFSILKLVLPATYIHVTIASIIKKKYATFKDNPARAFMHIVIAYICDLTSFAYKDLHQGSYKDSFLSAQLLTQNIESRTCRVACKRESKVSRVCFFLLRGLKLSRTTPANSVNLLLGCLVHSPGGRALRY